MTRTPKPLAVAIALALSLALGAGAAAEGSTLGLTEARSLTLAASSSLKKYALALEAAGLVKEAQAYAALPVLTASVAGSSSGESLAALGQALSGSAALKASLTLFDGGKNAALVGKAGTAAEAALQSMRAQRLSLIGQADTAYLAVLEAQASADAAALDLQAAQVRLQIAQAKEAAGALSKADYLQTESEAAGYEASLAKARKSLLSAQAKLASLTGRPQASPAAVDFSSYAAVLGKLAALDDAGLDRFVADLTALAKANSPTWKGYDLSVEEARHSLTAAKAAYLPTVTGAASQAFGLGSSGLSSTTSLSVTASLSLDLWSTANAVSQADLAVREGLLDAAEGQGGAALDLAQAAYAWVASALAIPSSTKALEYAQTNYDNVLAKYRLSAASTSDLSTAEALLSTSRTALTSARYAFLQDLSTLRGLVGLEDEAEVLSRL